MSEEKLEGKWQYKTEKGNWEDCNVLNWPSNTSVEKHLSESDQLHHRFVINPEPEHEHIFKWWYIDGTGKLQLCRDAFCPHQFACDCGYTIYTELRIEAQKHNL